jgi:hypothetical protein
MEQQQRIKRQRTTRGPVRGDREAKATTAEEAPMEDSAPSAQPSSEPSTAPSAQPSTISSKQRTKCTAIMTVKAQRRQLERKRERLTRLQIERGDITKAYATALRKVHWPHILHQHCTCEDDGLCEYLRAKYNAEDNKGDNSRHPSQAAHQVH